MVDREELIRRKELILQRERVFANQVGSAVFEKPKVSYWMVLAPFLFLFFIYRMQKYKSGRLKFDEDFMITRGRVMDEAVEALTRGSEPNIDAVVGRSTLPDGPAREKYESWTRVLAEYFTDLLSAAGDSFEAMVRSAYRSRTEYLLILNRLNTAEREFYSALRSHMSETEGAGVVIDVIEECSQKLRRELAESIFA